MWVWIQIPSFHFWGAKRQIWTTGIFQIYLFMYRSHIIKGKKKLSISPCSTARIYFIDTCWSKFAKKMTQRAFRVSYLCEFNRDFFFHPDDTCIYHLTPVWMCLSSFLLQICNVAAIFEKPFFAFHLQWFPQHHLNKQRTLLSWFLTICISKYLAENCQKYQLGKHGRHLNKE